jgi:hypothetical protein
MSNEERQRTLREAGHRPAEAEKEEGAKRARERLGRLEGELEAEQADQSEQPTPAPEDDPDKPRPRR